MHADGHDVAVAGERGFSHALFAQAPWPWIDAPLQGSYFDLRRAMKILSREIEKRGFDLIHTHYRRPTMVARWLQKTVRTFRSFTPCNQPRIALNPFRRLLTDFGDHTHVASADALEWLTTTARVPRERITVIPHGVDPARFPLRDPSAIAAARAQLGVPMDATLAAFVGRFDDPKNPLWYHRNRSPRPPCGSAGVVHDDGDWAARSADVRRH